MANPYSHAAKASYKEKAKAMGKVNNLDIPVMRAVGENKKGGIHESSTSGQHQDQAAKDGFKRGGAVPTKPKTLPKVMTGITAGANGMGRMEKAKKYGI